MKKKLVDYLSGLFEMYCSDENNLILELRVGKVDDKECEKQLIEMFNDCKGIKYVVIPAPDAEARDKLDEAKDVVVEKAKWIVKLLYDGGFVTAEPLEKALATLEAITNET